MVSFIVYCPKIIKVAFILLSKILLALKIAELSRALVFFSQWLNVCACQRHKLAQPSHHTFSVIHSESWKTEQVTMKANFIYFCSVESEFVIKNSIFPWTSELAYIWHFLRKLDYFWLFLSTLVLATLVTKLSLSFL